MSAHLPDGDIRITKRGVLWVDDANQIVTMDDVASVIGFNVDWPDFDVRVDGESVLAERRRMHTMPRDLVFATTTALNTANERAFNSTQSWAHYMLAWSNEQNPPPRLQHDTATMLVSWFSDNPSDGDINDLHPFYPPLTPTLATVVALYKNRKYKKLESGDADADIGATDRPASKNIKDMMALTMTSNISVTPIVATTNSGKEEVHTNLTRAYGQLIRGRPDPDDLDAYMIVATQISDIAAPESAAGNVCDFALRLGNVLSRE